MNLDFIPLWLVSVITALFMVISIHTGFLFGNSKRLRFKNEKEPSVSATSTAILSLLSFLLVFCFDIAYERYDSKKELVREESNLIRTTWQRADFLPEQNIAETRLLLKKYVDVRVAIADSKDLDAFMGFLNSSKVIQNELWNTAVLNARKDMNSDVAALYIESLNDLFSIEATRVDIGIRARIPFYIWILLYILVFLGMFSMGYLTAVTESSRTSWTSAIMVLSFTLIIFLIFSLDRPNSSFIVINQAPLRDLRSWMETVKEVPNIQGDSTIHKGIINF